MVLSLLAPLAAAAASVAAGLVVFAMWNHQTGADVLRETRREVVAPGDAAEVPIELRVGGHARLRNLRVEYVCEERSVEPDDLEIEVTTGPDDGLTVLDWIALSGLEQFGPRRAHHYEAGEHGAHDVFVWEPETDFVDRARIRLRTGLDDATIDVNIRVAFVEHLTRMQLRTLRRGHAG